MKVSICILGANKKVSMLEAEEEYVAKNWKTTGNIKSAEKLVTSHLRLVAKLLWATKAMVYQ